MSAKEEFLKKLQENEEKRVANEKRISSDIQAYQNAQLKLINDIKTWIADAPIKINVQDIDFSDESIPLKIIFKMYHIEVSNNNKKMIIKPNMLYYMDQSGGMSVEYQGFSATDKPMLFMKSSLAKDIPDDCLILALKTGSTTNYVPFTEDEFFKLLIRIA